MTKSIKIKNKKYGKKLLALLLSILTIFSCFVAMPFNAFASKETYAGHELHYVDGKDAFCINYGVSSSGQFKNDDAAVTYWKSLGATKQDKIREIISCAAENKYLNSSNDATYQTVL